MTALSSDLDFQSELKSFNSWFSALNEMERMTALCELVRHADLAQMVVFAETLAGNIEQKRVDLLGAMGSAPARKDANLGKCKCSWFLCYVENV